MFAVHGDPHGRTSLPTRQPPGFTQRKPLWAAVSEIYPEKDTHAFTLAAKRLADTKGQWAPLREGQRGQRETEEYGGGRGFCCVRCPQPSGCSSACCSASEAAGGEFGVRGNPRKKLETISNWCIPGMKRGYNDFFLQHGVRIQETRDINPVDTLKALHACTGWSMDFCSSLSLTKPLLEVFWALGVAN